MDQLGYPILLTWARCVRVAGDGRPFHGDRRVEPSDAEEMLFVAQRFETWVIHCHRFRQTLQDP